MAKVTVSKIETDGQSATVMLSNGDELHGLLHVDTCAEVESLSRFKIEGYIMPVSKMPQTGYN